MPMLSHTHLAAARTLLMQARLNEEASEWAESAGRAYEPLFRQLAPVLGSASVRALLARCIKLNRAELPGLSRIDLSTAPSAQPKHVADEIASALAPLAPDRQLEIATSLYATFFALLTTFIGERLTWRILQMTPSEDDGTASKETQ